MVRNILIAESVEVDPLCFPRNTKDWPVGSGVMTEMKLKLVKSGFGLLATSFVEIARIARAWPSRFVVVESLPDEDTERDDFFHFFLLRSE